MEQISAGFGVPLAPEKTDGPVMLIMFLGIEIDLVSMECRLPEGKVLDLRQVVGKARLAKKIRLRECWSFLILFGCSRK